MSMTRAFPFISDHRFACAFLATFIALCAFFIPADVAWASIADDINAWLCGVLRDWCNWIFAAQTNVLKSIGVGGVLSAPFDSMLTSAGTCRCTT